MTRIKKYFTLGTAIISVLSITGMAQDEQKKESKEAPQGIAALPVTVAVQKVTEKVDYQVRRYNGQAVPPASVQIVPRVTGELLEVGFKDGANVKKGQLLYSLKLSQ